MKVTKIKVSAGRTFNHPYEQFSNFRLHVELVAEIEEGEQYCAIVKGLQTQAEILAEEQKQETIGFLGEEYQKQFNDGPDDHVCVGNPPF